jgi:protein transport protein SEC31
MVKLEEINATSTFAWSLDTLPLLVSGTVAGAVDVNFNSTTNLEIWDIFSATNKSEPIVKADVSNRFYTIGWSKPFAKYSRGLIVGAFEDGSIDFWDAEKLIKSKDLSSSKVHTSKVHKGPVKTLQFNPIQNNVLVTGGSNGQIFIWNCEKFNEEPFSPGKAMTPMDEVTSVAWNNSVSHIFASTGNGGYTSVWDLKSKREVLHLQYTNETGARASFSHVAWHPTQSTKLITASENDSCPVILTWDLRNANEPEKVLTGHKKGVLSLDWCKQDPELLISSGKDNNTVLWNPVTAQKLGEYPTTANWTFLTRFAPSSPDIFATASFDGKIVVQSLQDTTPPVSTKVSSNDDNTFWSQLSTAEIQQPVFQIKQAPQWLKRPCSAAFGFGSKLVLVSTDADGKSVIKISKVPSTSNTSSTDLVKALNENNFDAIIESKLESGIEGIEKSDWEVLKKLTHTSKDDLFREINTGVEGEKETLVNGDKKSLSDDSFFDNLESELQTSTDYIPEGEFKIFNSSESEEDKKLIKLILNKKLELAVDSCLKQNKLSEAFVLALDASDAIKQKVKNFYFKNNSDNTVSRILYSTTANNVTDIVSHASVENWKEIASSISSFSSSPDEFNSKITELGDRLLNSKDGENQRDNAITCYLAGSALNQISSIWLKELPDFEAKLLKSKSASISTPSEARLATLTNFVQKVSTYRSIAKETGVLSGPAAEQISRAILEYCNLIAGSGEFELAQKFLSILPTEFAKIEKDRISKATGKATTVTAKLAAANTGRGNAKSPIRANASGYTPAIPTNSFVPPVATPPISYTPPVVAPPVNAYNPPVARPTVPAMSQPTVAPVSNPYARANPYTPQASHNNIYKAAAQPNAYAPASDASTPLPPPKSTYKNETEGWNDLPDTFKKTAPRRAAPSQTQLPTTAATNLPTPSSAKIPPANNVAPPPPKTLSRKSSSSSAPTQSKSPVPTPQQVSSRYAPPATVNDMPTTPGLGSTSSFSSPSHPKKNPYAPTAEINTPKVSLAQPPRAVPNPIGSPNLQKQNMFTSVKNPYAPPPQAAGSRVGSSGSFGPSAGIAPPPMQSFGEPRQSGYAPVGPSTTSVPPPPMGPSSSNHVGSNPPPPPPAVNQQPPAAPAKPEQPTYPAGDRSHIPEASLPIYESLSRVFNSIKPNIPEKYDKHAQDMEKRLNILFDHLNNQDLLSGGATESLKSVANALEGKDFVTAASLNASIAATYPEEVGHWHTGVKRLITMAEAMY